MELELRHLRTICAIAECGSFTRAAAALGATQPALSALSAPLRRIERALGGSLFIRSRDGVVTADYGATVLARARTVLAEVSAVRWQRPAGDVAVPGYFRPPPGVVVLPLARDPMLMRHLIAWQAFGRLAAHADELLRLARRTPADRSM